MKNRPDHIVGQGFELRWHETKPDACMYLSVTIGNDADEYKILSAFDHATERLDAADCLFMALHNTTDRPVVSPKIIFGVLATIRGKGLKTIYYASISPEEYFDPVLFKDQQRTSQEAGQKMGIAVHLRRCATLEEAGHWFATLDPTGGTHAD